MPDDAASWAALILGPLAAIIAGYLGYRAAENNRHDEREREEAERVAREGQTAIEGFQRLAQEQRIEYERRLSRIEQRLEKVERELEIEKRVSRSALTYVTRLLDYIADRMPGQSDVPPAPDELHPHLPRSIVENWRIPPPHNKPEG